MGAANSAGGTVSADGLRFRHDHCFRDGIDYRLRPEAVAAAACTSGASGSDSGAASAGGSGSFDGSTTKGSTAGGASTAASTTSSDSGAASAGVSGSFGSSRRLDYRRLDHFDGFRCCIGGRFGSCGGSATKGSTAGGAITAASITSTGSTDAAALSVESGRIRSGSIPSVNSGASERPHPRERSPPKPVSASSRNAAFTFDDHVRALLHRRTKPRSTIRSLGEIRCRRWNGARSRR